MAKFIEVNIGSDNSPIYINADLIETIIPYGEQCIIRLASERDAITANHSALWVISLINGTQL